MDPIDPDPWVYTARWFEVALNYRRPKNNAILQALTFAAGPAATHQFHVR
jgi:hypothetical protein